MKKLQEGFADLWGSIILETKFNLIQDEITMDLKSIDHGETTYYKLRFCEVSAYYYAKNTVENRYEFYDEDKVEYLEITTIDYENDIIVNLQVPDEKEWSQDYSSQFNVSLEIWNSILYIEARQVIINDKIYNLRN